MGRWLQKPLTGFYDLDRTHPSAHKLLIYLPVTEGALVAPANIATPTMTTSLSGFPVWKDSARYRGGVLCNSGGSSHITVANPANVNAAAGDFMVRLLMRPYSAWPGAFTEFVSKGTTGRELCLFADTSGNLSFYGVGGINSSISIPTGMTAGQDWDFLWYRHLSTHTVYVNGVFKGTWSDGGAFAQQGANAPWTFGSNASGGGSDGNIIYAGIQFWQRQPYPGEVLALYTDPFGMLKPRIARRYVIPPAAGKRFFLIPA